MEVLGQSDYQVWYLKFQVFDQQSFGFFEIDYQCCCFDIDFCFDYDFYRFCYYYDQILSCLSVLKDNL